MSAFSVQLWQLIVLRGMTGAALAALIPVAQSMVADMTSDKRRGRVFGVVGAAGWCGAVGGTVFATSVGNRTHAPLSLRGYSFVLLVLGVGSMLLGVLTWAIAADPPRSSSASSASSSDSAASSHATASGAAEDTHVPTDGSRCSRFPHCSRPTLNSEGLCREVFSVRTFQLLVLQGLANSIADIAVSTFLTLWLQNVGFSSGTASLISSLTSVGCALGACAGGFLGDAAAVRMPASGRVFVAQIGLATCALCWLLIFFQLDHTSRGAVLAVTCLVAGTLGAFYTPGTNKPILSEVVRPSHRAAAIAWQYSASTASGAVFGTLGPGYLATAMGYVAYTQPVSHLTPEQRRGNATALAHAVALLCAPAWTFCVIVYSSIICTYPRDRARASAKEAAEATDAHADWSLQSCQAESCSESGASSAVLS